MADVTLSRWRKFGFDRLYVNASDGARVGWVDLRTGEVSKDNAAAWQPDLDAAIDAWCAEQGINLPPSTSSSPSPPPPPPPAADRLAPEIVPGSPPVQARPQGNGRLRRPGKDLAKNKPGAAVKAAAKERMTWWSRLKSLFGIETPSSSWDAGYEGECKVARTVWIMRLFGWRVLHSVPVGSRGADIDHLLIGPGGVVTVNTKHHRGAKVTAGRTKVLVNGQPTQYAAKSTFEASRTADVLTSALGRPVDVEAIIVIVGARNVRNGSTAGIDVLTRADLPFWLLGRRGRLNREQRRELFEIARRSTTWQPA